MTGLIVALDTPDLPKAEALATELSGKVAALKVGLTLFSAYGPEAVGSISKYAPVFCDAKLHDIPVQVSGAVAELAISGAWMITVHASGGPAMVAAAAQAASLSPTPPLIAAVTVLTSLGSQDLYAVGQGVDVSRQVGRLAAMAVANGATALVCSGHEIAIARAVGGDVKLVVPGVRPPGSSVGDQSRVMTPREASEAGADYIVVGRPITEAPDPVAAAIQIASELR